MKNTSVVKRKGTSHLSNRDRLTGLYDRKGFSHTAGNELTKACRENSPMTLFYINIDDFVGIKKRFGIEEANKLLISLATRLKKNCRTVDVIARFHADEFIILCPQTGPDSAMTILHRLQEVLDRFINESNGSVNANIGALTYLVCPASVELIIERLETIMHALKRGGTAGTVHQVIESN